MTISYYYIYETKNVVNNKFYVGAHKSHTLENNTYLGSGRHIRHAIDFYGAENFENRIIEIVAVVDHTLNHKQWNEIVHPRESYWINFYKKSGVDLYNINTDGAFGGSTTHGTRWVHNKETGEHRMISKTTDIPDGFHSGRLHDTKTKQTGTFLFHNIKTGEERRFKSPPNELWVKGSQKQSAVRTGEKNPSHGKHWYMNQETKQYIYCTNQPDGFVKGHPDWRDPSKMIGWSKI